MTENTETNPEYPEFKMSAGAKSLTQFLLVIGTFIPVNIWHDANSIGPGDYGMGMVMGFLMFFLWFPLLIASLIFGTKAILENNGRTKGIITVGSVAVLFLLAVIQSILHYS